MNRSFSKRSTADSFTVCFFQLMCFEPCIGTQLEAFGRKPQPRSPPRAGHCRGCARLPCAAASLLALTPIPTPLGLEGRACASRAFELRSYSHVLELRKLLCIANPYSASSAPQSQKITGVCYNQGSHLHFRIS